ncbi:hypothetical protein F383_37403 [Gossypium arboreum]|uniref:Uncharacterized protein n=1 Tax=Gossypium arboreum TaxID=29729 RepID=A0A0B0MC53_GOSAR|nr:hypothetical protein F383_37403 [Gossypium arboreum]
MSKGVTFNGIEAIV